ncbi:MAG: hypothetical protein M1826_002321 [Phylliscum demangeonii]|nr:MAG: hypothetical protein M1826_002321 [Phylliscum demangeonii]
MSRLVRRWGEHAVKRGPDQLAIHCFSCTGVETVAVLTSRRAKHTTTLDGRLPASSAWGPGEAKMPSLKLMTSFDDAASTSPSFDDRDRTPMHGPGSS